MRIRNYISMGSGALKTNVLGSKIPLSVMFSVTNRCTSKCLYCDIPLRNQKELTTGEALSLIDEMTEAGVQKLSLWGGEPLLRDDIADLIDRAKSGGMLINIDSNGYLIPAKLDEIKHLDFIILSFDGEKEYHDKNRETGAYDKFFRAVKIINGRIPIWTLTVLTKHNINSVDFIIQKAKEYGFQTMFQVPYHPVGIGSQNDIFAKPNEYQRVFQYLIDLKGNNAPIISSTNYLRIVAQWPFFPETTSNDSFNGNPKCWAGKLFCNIDTNGDVYPCSPMINGSSRLNILDKGFKDCFVELPTPPCRICLSACSMEANLAFSFDALTIWEWARNFKKTKKSGISEVDNGGGSS
jgi:MoaA/NifB/PqqE/SkfB family radical SAM enzyme